MQRLIAFFLTICWTRMVILVFKSKIWVCRKFEMVIFSYLFIKQFVVTNCSKERWALPMMQRLIAFFLTICWTRMVILVFKSKIWVCRKFEMVIFSYLFIKQFVVTNCSKERSGSIVTKTLKNWILISIATSKELHFNADFKYISFIKFSLSHQKLRTWENLPYLGK